MMWNVVCRNEILFLRVIRRDVENAESKRVMFLSRETHKLRCTFCKVYRVRFAENSLHRCALVFCDETSW